MINVNKNLIDKVLELKPQEKIFLIEALVESLDKPDKNIQEIWLKEAKARLEAHRQGKTKGIPLEDVFGESL
jgi:putative addiction module component (TIGR02574 family)